MGADGLFLDIVKGVLDHDLKKVFTSEELEEAKQKSLKIMYRVWFLAYAESRNLLPVRDEKYKPISLRNLRSRLDSYQSQPDGSQCWNALLKLFEGVRKGSPEHNLPQYAGALFEYVLPIDGITIKNRFIVGALYGLLERDGEGIDYTNLSVRHLGNIFESLMEFGVRQTDRDILLLEDKNGVRTIDSVQEVDYSYKRNDLYLASKGGIALRKMSASFYTPDKIVEFLVRRGIEPIFAEREKLIGDDLDLYKKSKSKMNLQVCMGRLLDIQVLDPAMGSGHFLVEALNQLTSWVTNVLQRYPEHPLLQEIDADRDIILSEQQKKGVTIDESLLTHDVLLKRKIMKRCIFGVDLNPMAVELAKLSLWLDSFAIGVPLTYMDHHIKAGDSTIGMFLKDLKGGETHTLDDWLPGAESNRLICDVITNSDITVERARASEETYLEHQKSLEPTRRILDALTTSKIKPEILPKKSKLEFIHRFGKFTKNDSDDLGVTRKIINNMAQRHRFFHWELEMMDAFTDSRRGFDLIVGNPPWDKVKLYDDEFFTKFDPTFRSLSPKTKKKSRMKEILSDASIAKAYKQSKNHYKEKNTVYGNAEIYEMQGVGDNDLWKVILERMFTLMADGGFISMVIPSQILSNSSTIKMRRHMLEKDILSMYVFENNKKIFPIDSRYKFALLTVKNAKGPDKFPIGFYLHHLDSLDDNNREKDKFGTLSKKSIIKLSPDECIIPEILGLELSIFEKLHKNLTLESGLGDGWNMEMSRGFDRTIDSDLLSENGKGWPVFEGKNINQYNHRWTKPKFTTNKRRGLERESKRRIFDGNHVAVHDSFRLVFRDTARANDTRTSITAILPPNVFHTNTLRSILLTYEDQIDLNANYYKKIAYMCGLLNSLTFDFITRGIIQISLAPIINSIPVPNPIHENQISQLVAKIVVGTLEFEGFAESLRIDNTALTPVQKLDIVAEIDALVAHSYNLTYTEYKTIIDSFRLFRTNPNLYHLDEIIWNNNNLKEFYGEMSELALQYFKAIAEEDEN